MSGLYMCLCLNAFLCVHSAAPCLYAALSGVPICALVSCLLMYLCVGVCIFHVQLCVPECISTCASGYIFVCFCVSGLCVCPCIFPPRHLTARDPLRRLTLVSVSADRH